MPLTGLILRAAACTTALAALSGCGPERNQFAPPCPRTSFPATTADLSAYRANSSGRDLSDLVVGGRMMAIHGSCTVGKDKGTVAASVTVSADVQRGPALRGDQADVPVYVAVIEGDRILDKRVYNLRAEFGSNVDRVNVTSPEVFMVLPVSATKTAAAYSIVAGFQLTADELAANRGASAH